MWIQLLSLGLIDGASEGVAPVSPEPAARPGVKRARFLRRSAKDVYRFPWEQEDAPEAVVVAPAKRKRIPLPVVAALEKAAGPIPIQTVREISAPAISIPELGTAVLQAIEDEDEDWLWLI